MIKKFSLPGFIEKHDLVMLFLNYYREHKEYFYEDRIIDSFYGADPRLIWRGGRDIPVQKNQPTMQEIIDNFSQFNRIKLRHVFTNCLITEQICNDYLCNQFVKRYIRLQDEVIINHPLLIEHFKQNYPHIPIIYSTTIGITDIDKINDLTKNNIYVMNYNYNNNETYIKSLKHPEHIEILCAEPCIPNCPNRMKHYTAISKGILDVKLTPNDITSCPFKSEGNIFSKIMQLPHAITNKRINELSEMGFEYFKISGRTIRLPQWIETIVYYLVKPEYCNLVYETLIDVTLSND